MLWIFILSLFVLQCGGIREANEIGDEKNEIKQFANKHSGDYDRLIQMVGSMNEKISSLQSEVTSIRRKTKHSYETLKRLEIAANGQKCSQVHKNAVIQPGIIVDGGVHRSRCPPEFNLRRRNSCYQTVAKKVTWQKAREECRALNSNLVAIETEGENKFLMNHINSDEGIQNCDFWTGATDIRQEGSWLWNHTGLPLSYTHWHTLEPNNGSGDEHCMWLDWYFNWQWNDATCTRQRACFICEAPRRP